LIKNLAVVTSAFFENFKFKSRKLVNGKQMNFFSRIRIRLILSFFLVAFIPALIISLYAMQTITNTLHQQVLSEQATIIKTLNMKIEAFFTSIENDLVFLSQSQPMAHYLNLRSTFPPNSPALKKACQAVEQEFFSFSRIEGIYYQVRYLDETGQEVVRIDANGVNTQVVAQAQLENKSHFYYFKETMQLLKKEVFVSYLELNKEYDQIEIPHQPVIRYATPIYYPDKRRAGIVITNVDANQFLQLLGETLLVDQDGYYLAHPEEKKRWGNDLNTDYRLAQDYPHSVQTILEETDGVISAAKVTLIFQRVLIPESGFWILIREVPTDELLQRIDRFYITIDILLIFAILFALIIALLHNRQITIPIVHLTQIIKQVSAGDGEARAKVEQVSELGTLGHELNTMLNTINANRLALQRTKQEVEAENLAKSRFLAGMSHELRTPLNAIIGYGEMLQEDIDALGDVDLSSDIEKIYAAGKYLLNTINDILDMSKIEAGKMDIYNETFYLPNMLDDIVDTLQPLLKNNKEILEVHYADELGEMCADLIKLRQILLKLLSNASQFNKGNGSISLDVLCETDEDENQWIIFCVQDHGVGLDDEQKQRLFHHFKETDMSSIRKSGGTGLGLVITYLMVQMMGGKINVESELGKGSTFTVRLPALVETSVKAYSLSVPHSEPIVLEEGNLVLVIDDDKQVRYVLENYLCKLGYQVEVADGGEEGLKLAKKLLPDIITLDVMMHKMDGWEVLSHLKADPNLASIPVIMLSMIEEKHIGYSLGASDYLIKPITREKLLKVLQKYHLSFHESARLIMVIDDDVVSRDMVARILRKAGWQVCKVGDGQVALNTIQKKQPDLILLDLQMHEIDAFEFIAKLQENYDSIPIVVLTAKDITAKDRLRLNKVAGIFQKGSYRRDELLALIYKLNT
jgi:signal transduction histidine kinase/CheY-like chemotaxis protein